MRHILTILIVTAVFYSCKKVNNYSPEIASVNVVNAAVDAGAVKVNYFGRAITWAVYTPTVSNNANAFYSLPVAKEFPLAIVQSPDSTKVMFNGALDLNARDVYSLYLCGQSGSYESVLIKEDIMPAIYPDSSMRVRVINLSPNSPAVNVTLSTSTTTNEFVDLTYKKISDFKSYSTKKENGTAYTFQVRKASDNSLITSVNVPFIATSGNVYQFKYITLVLRGMLSPATPAAGITIVKSF